jgi:hypothetical protein
MDKYIIYTKGPVIMDIKDIVENTKNIYMSESSLKTLMDFERVLDELDMYAFKNWSKGELVEGPVKSKHWVECTFMWPNKAMPDPDAAKRLLQYNVVVEYSKDKLKTPTKVENYSDFVPGTKVPKNEENPIWLVKIKMPSEIVSDAVEGFIELEGRDVDLSELDSSYESGLDNMTAQPVEPGVI